MVNKPDDPSRASFRAFLSDYRTAILVILLAACAWRLILVIGFPHGAVDEIRYTAPAVNMLAGRGFSADVQAPYLPSEHTVPLYPVFIASVYAVFGEHNSAVRIAQAVIDTLTCLLVAFVSFNLAPVSLKRSAAVFSLVICGFLSWFTVFWTRYILAETLAIFLTMLAVTLSIWALRGPSWRWVTVGATCGLALLVRADAVILLFAFVLFLLFRVAYVRSAASFICLLLFLCVIPLVLAPWIARNYIALGKFQPLSNPYGKPHGEYVPTGYLLWIKTWMTDATDNHAADLIFHPGNRDFDPRQLPNDTFDSAEEREEVFRLIDRYNQTGEMTPELSDRFRDLANQRIKRAPARYYVRLPLKRIASMWLTGFSTSNTLHMLARMVLVLPLLVGGLLGFLFWTRNSMLAVLLVLIILSRTLLFSFLSAEARYIVEAYPPVIAACGVTAAVVWSYLNLIWKGRASLVS
jgi:4-amino-4-deoxy-L-arabinose transferase-like glycosyltransferase